MRKQFLFFTLVFILSANLLAQTGAAINMSGNQPHQSAILDISSDSLGILIPRMTEVQKNAILSPANGLLIYQTDGTDGFWYYNGTTWTQAIGPQGIAGATGADGVTGSIGPTGPIGPTGLSAAPAHYIGELYGGGVVFYVDGTGNHGLICSMVNTSASTATWSNVISTAIGANAQSSWNGSTNTTAIINQSGHSSSAAKLCNNYTNVDYGTGVYSDWYLPSVDEFYLLYDAKYQITKTLETDGNSSTTPLSKYYYWTSTEHNYGLAWRWDWNLYYNNTNQYYSNNYIEKTNSYYVRAIRAF